MFSNTHNSWFQIHEQWGHRQIIAHLLSPSVWNVSAEADSQRTFKAQVHHTLHQEDSLPDRADRSLPPLEVRGPRGGIQLGWLRYVSFAKDIYRILSTGSHAGDIDLISSGKDFWMIQAWDVLNQHVADFEKFCWKQELFSLKIDWLDWLLWSHWKLALFSSVAAFRDADGDVDTCPMWTFPTVRPTSMNKLQKGYTHTDSEVRPRSGHLHTCNYYYLLFY